MQDKTSLGISDTFREFIKALVKEVVTNGESFDAQKKWLRKYSEAEGVNYASLEQNLEDLFQIIEEWRTNRSKSGQIAMKMLAKDSYLSEEMVDELIGVTNENDLQEKPCRELEDFCGVEQLPLLIKNGVVVRCTDYCYNKGIVIPSEFEGRRVTMIVKEAFRNCKIHSITIPDSVTTIGSSAFRGCPELTAVTLPSSISEIEDNTFLDCSKLTSINLPNSVTRIGDQAFQGCSGLSSIFIPDSVVNIESAAFCCSGLTSVVLPKYAKTIELYSFSGCTALKSVIIPDSVTKIGSFAFKNCSLLTSISIPDSVNEIGKGAFYGCAELKSIIIPGSVTIIGESAFEGCKNLSSVMILSRATKIEYGAFRGCSKLTSIKKP